MLNAGTKLTGRWTVGRHLGSGTCAEVYEVRERDPEGGGALVVKCIPLPQAKSKKSEQKEQQRIADTLYYEYTLYTNGLLYGFGHAPKIPRGAYGQDAGHRYLVMEALDMDLRAFASTQPSFAAIADIGLQILAGLQFIHAKGYVFVDIKPDNFMIKRIDGNDKLFFIDFGLMEKVTGYRSGGAQREETHRATVAGTVAYVSLGVHRGGTPSRRDDLEAMAYVLLAITSPDCALPWLGPHIRSDADCLAVKESTDMNSVCHAQGCPQLGDIIAVCRTSEYSVEPNYARIKALLASMRELKGTPKQIRRKSSAADAGHGSYQVASAAGRRASRTDQAVVNLVGSDDEPNTRPTKAASLKRKASATTPLADPAQTPLLLDEPPASRSRKAATAALSKVNTSDAAIGLKVVVIAGPHKGMSAMLIQPCRGTAAKSVKRGGKRNADDSCYDDALCIGRTCEESSAAAFLMLPEDEYVSDSHAYILYGTNSRGHEYFRLRDIGSTNGVTLNKQKILSDTWVDGNIGDTFRVGATTLQVVQAVK